MAHIIMLGISFGLVGFILQSLGITTPIVYFLLGCAAMGTMWKAAG